MREQKFEVLIVGAGPVGLFAAISLAEAGIKVGIIDREERTAAHSYACALHPRSLELFDQCGLATDLIDQGRRLPTMAFYMGNRRIAEINFSKLAGRFPFLLALPQNALEAVLESKLQHKSGITVKWNHRLDQVENEKDMVIAGVEQLGGTAVGYVVPHWETVVIRRLQMRAQFLVGADGHNSLVRHRLGLEYEKFAGPEAFAAIEFTTTDPIDDEVRVALHEGTTNVLWPLPGGRYRWTFQLTHPEGNEEFPDKARRAGRSANAGMDEDLRRWIQSVAWRRAPWFRATIHEIVWCTQVAFEHRLAKQFGTHNCWLVGDAAHQTAPFGAQSMNIGLLEADALATTLQKLLQEEATTDSLQKYNRQARDQWRRLLGLSASLKEANGVTKWPTLNAAQILPCLPGSAADLTSLTRQLGLQLVE